MTGTLYPNREAAREARLAATLAARGTADWRAAGAHLTATRAQAAADAAARQATQAMARRLAEANARPVGDRELDRACRLVHRAVADAQGDYPEVCTDTLYAELLPNVLHGARPALVAEVRRVLL
jgi:hypothetical protein